MVFVPILGVYVDNHLLIIMYLYLLRSISNCKYKLYKQIINYYYLCWNDETYHTITLV